MNHEDGGRQSYNTTRRLRVLPYEESTRSNFFKLFSLILPLQVTRKTFIISTSFTRY